MGVEVQAQVCIPAHRTPHQLKHLSMTPMSLFIKRINHVSPYEILVLSPYKLRRYFMGIAANHWTKEDRSRGATPHPLMAVGQAEEVNITCLHPTGDNKHFFSKSVVRVKLNKKSSYASCCSRLDLPAPRSGCPQ